MPTYSPPSLKITVTSPGMLGLPSYMDSKIVTSTQPGVYPVNSLFDAWCALRPAPITVPGTYTANAYSSYEIGLLSATLPGIGGFAGLDNVNWLLNNIKPSATTYNATINGTLYNNIPYYNVTGLGLSNYTYGDIQQAISTLLGQGTPTNPLLGAWTPADVTAIVGQASTVGEGFVPDVTDLNPDNNKLAVILDTFVDGNNNGIRDGAETSQQPLIITVESAALGNFVWEDLNADGAQDANEPGIAGVTVNLVRDLNSDGDFLDANELLATKSTDGSGFYKFTGLTPGLDYQVQFEKPGAYISFTKADAIPPGTDATDSDANVSTGVTPVVVLAPGQYNQTIDAGLLKPAALGDRVWSDTDADGQQDAGEPGVANVTVELYKCVNDQPSGLVLATDVTDANGIYNFTNLAPGEYIVKFITPAGFTLTTANVGADGSDSDAGAGGLTGCYSLESGETDNSVDAGLVPLARIGDRVWEDTDGDGQQDGGENGIPGATVKLYTCVNNAPGVFVAQTTTDAQGNYSFGNLLPGDYIVEFTTPNGFTRTQANVGADGTDSDNVGGLSGCYNLSPGENEDTVDAGFYRPAALGDRVWSDTDADGQQDAGEPGVANVTVELYKCVNDQPSGLVLATDVTDANGIYNFTNLAPGEYIVKFITPAGFTLTTANVGADGSDSDAGAGGLTGCYSLESGETDNSVDAGLVPLARIGDRVWEDTDGDGQQDGGENGIPGATVKLYTCVNNAPGVFVAQTTTDAQGNYSFGNLLPGDYIVEFTTPNGFTRTQANVGADGTDSDNVGGLSGCYNLSPGENEDTVDAGFYRPAALGDRVWSDTDADGQQDAGEPGVANVTVELYKCVNDQPSGLVLATDVTDANGIYNFTNLAPGEYIVKFITPAGFTLTTANVGADGSDSDAGAGGLTGCYSLESGETDNSVDAGLVPLARIGDRVWEDTDGDGQQDGGENGIPGATVKLYTCVNNAPGVFVAQTTTDAQGNYSFGNLLPGDYIVEFTTPNGFTRTQANVGADGTDSDNVGGLSGCYNLSPGENEDTVDAGFYRPAALGDRVWSDTDADGQQDAGEPGVANVTVELYKCVNDQPSGLVLATDVTDANGIYNFTNLAPGEYIVKFITPAGFTLTTANVGADGSDSDAGAGGLTGCYSLESGETDNSVDAGLVPLARIGDRVWEDTDGDGQQDGGENGIPGATVKLYTCVNNAPGVFVAQTTTDAQGNYSFGNLLPGDYIVEFTTPNGFTRTQANVGADGTDSDNVGGLSGCYNLSPGENEDTVDAGFYRPAALGDRVWSDTDADGQQDAGEPGVANVTVELYKCVNDQPSGLVLATDVTDANGIYNFTNLAPGEYIVKFITPAGFTLTTANVGADGSDSDAGAGGLTGCYSLESGETDNSVDAGLYRAAIDIEKLVRGEYQTGGNGGTEGLTPGFWKTHSEFGPAPLAGWPETGYSPTQSWEAVFGKDVPGTPTLLDALNTGGGGLEALLRHSTAALLNAANPNVDYAYSVAQIISMTQSAITSGSYDATKNLFEFQNEKGADLSTPAPGPTLIVTPDFDADTPGSGPQIPVGGKAVFTYLVTNTGTVEISNVSVTDNRLTGLTFLGGDSDNDTKLDVGEEWRYQAEEIVSSSAEIANTGTVTGTGGSIPVTDSDKAHYNGSPLTQSLGDFVWMDANRNGLQDSAEAGIGGLTVTLIGGGVNGIIGSGGDDTTATTTTDANGYYQFGNLTAGVEYQVMFSKPANTAFTTQDVNSNGNDTADSDANPSTGKSQIVTLTPGQNNPTLDAGAYLLKPGIDIEKKTNGSSNTNPTAPNYDNEDAASGAGVPILTPGSDVTWTYKVTNTGNTSFASSAVAVVDDNGTPANAADDLSIANGKITYQSGDDGDNVLAPGEAWLYKATGTAQTLTTLGTATTFDFSGNSATDGTDGNTRTYTVGGITVNANAWSRDKSSGTWDKAFLGAYGGGHGVTDISEGTGSGDSHTVDNNGRDNYIVYQFSQNVVMDKAFLGYVVGDSDMTVYIGTKASPITTMDNSVLASMSAKEFNDTSSTSTRWADFNAGNVSGNVLIIAARDDGHSADYFKVDQVVVQPAQSGVYENKATVSTGAGGPTDSDLSHYKNPVAVTPAKIGDRVWCDTNGNGIQDKDEPGVKDVEVKLLKAADHSVVASAKTDSSGNYSFTVAPGDYYVQFVKPTAFGGFTKANQGADDSVDSDADVSTGKTAPTTLVAGENDLGWDAGLTPPKVTLTYDFSGSSAADGTDGNTRTVTVDGVTVTARAVSRHVDAAGNVKWEAAWLGAYGGGFGVTDKGEGSGSGNAHTVDNVGRGNYVLFQFSQNVVVDKTFLGYVVGDSDITAWVGSSATTLTNLSDAVLNGLTKEDNDTTSTTARWADINAGNKEGNVLVIAASTSDKTPDDYFKIDQLAVSTKSAKVTPIAIDLDGGGIQTVASADSGGKFDLLGNGQPVVSGWLAGGEGFLALDSNGNDKIDSISELFGGSKQGDGFAKLATFDSNGDGVVDASDVGYVDLSVWRDANGNHQTDPGELMSLAEAGVVSLDLDYVADAFMDAHGNLHLEQSSATMSDGRSVDMTDVYFAVAANDAVGLVGQATVDPGLLFA
jgi:uncharacterized repeat protein (TIGR01451 family)